MYQKIAAEMNLSETVFITRINPADSFTTGQISDMMTSFIMDY